MNVTIGTLASLGLVLSTAVAFAGGPLDERHSPSSPAVTPHASPFARGLGNLVPNGNLDFGREPWSAGTTGVSSWTTAENLFGEPGSGSLYVGGSGFEAIGSAQCIFLPQIADEPARFLLTGAGRNAVATNALSLRWELRFDGSSACNAGPPDRSATLVVATSTAWTLPQPVTVDIGADEWTSYSSINITLVASGRAPGGWFDGITMDVEAFPDVIFAGDFEPESTRSLPLGVP